MNSSYEKECFTCQTMAAGDDICVLLQQSHANNILSMRCDSVDE